ncbi:uncharacterized protein LOC121837000 [Ixodes scapularis]|uniref:uncharacterized protein LOC121837000 n=1 Tax=Ixodes scapularis TaxID=6945 RepID=UPI001C381EC7|nr:uncharacterized protein LOC121837000 [Ixodes scapularis]
MVALELLRVSAYCPPNRREESYSLLDASLSRVRFECYKDVVLLGDFNSHIDWWSRQEPYPSDLTDDILLDVTSAVGLQQVCRSATYQAQLAQGRALSFLDLVFTTDITRMLSCDVYPGLSKSDHQAIEVEYATCLPRKGRFARTLWNFYRTDHAHMAKLAHLAPWCLTTGDDCADNYELWCDFVGAIQKECVPCSRNSTRRKRSPWITPEIRKMAGQKRALFKRAARTQCQISLQSAKDLQRSIKSAISRAHSAYAHTISMKAKKDPKLFWQYFNGLQSSRQRPCFSRDHHPITSPRDVAQLFASQFSSAFSHNSSTPDPDLLVQTIEASTSQPVTCLPNLCLSLDDLHEAARLIRPSHCAGPDLLAPTFIKSLFPYLSFSLLSLFQSFLDHSYVPSTWKKALVTPVHKAWF